MGHVAAFALLVEVNVQLGVLPRFEDERVPREVQPLRFDHDVDAVFRCPVGKRDAALGAAVVGPESNRVGGGVVELLGRVARAAGDDGPNPVLVQGAGGHVIVDPRVDVLGGENLLPGLVVHVRGRVEPAVQPELVDQSLVVHRGGPVDLDLREVAAFRDDDAIVERVDILPRIGHAALDVDEDGGRGEE